MGTIKIKLYSALIGGIVLTSLGLFLFIEHYNLVTAHFLIKIGLINYVIFVVLYIIYINKKNRISKI
jgi:heme O synthase-like polyprenyltransferase